MNPEELRDVLDKYGSIPIDKHGQIREKETEKGEKGTFIPEAARCKDKLRAHEFYTLEILKDRCHTSMNWLDVCCGRMALLNHVDKHLKSKCRNVVYTGFDINVGYLRDCAILVNEKRLKDKLAGIDAKIGEVRDLRKIFHGKQYNLISLSNALHEIEPFYVADLFVECLDLCTDDGVFVIVDMQNLIEHEKYAVTWTDNEIEKILRPLFVSWKDDLIVSSDPISTGKGDKVNLFLTKVEKSKTVLCKRISAEEKDTIIDKIDGKIRCILREKHLYLDKEIRKHCLEGGRGENYVRKVDLYHTMDIYLKGYKKRKSVRL